MSTFTGTTLQWFSGLPDGHITSFAQFAANQVRPWVLYDLFIVRQREGETLKEYLNKFWALTVRLQTHDEDVMVTAFEQGIAAGPFNNSLIRNPVETFSEIRRRAVTHISTEEAVAMKNGKLYSKISKSKEVVKTSWPLRVNETSTGKKADLRHAPYKKHEPKTKGRRRPFPGSEYHTRSL